MLVTSFSCSCNVFRYILHSFDIFRSRNIFPMIGCCSWQLFFAKKLYYTKMKIFRFRELIILDHRKMERKVLGAKNCVRNFFLFTLFLNWLAHSKVIFLTFFDFSSLFVSVIYPKYRFLEWFGSKTNENSNRSIHVGMSKNRKNIDFCFFFCWITVFELVVNLKPLEKCFGLGNNRKLIFDIKRIQFDIFSMIFSTSWLLRSSCIAVHGWTRIGKIKNHQR